MPVLGCQAVCSQPGILGEPVVTNMIVTITDGSVEAGEVESAWHRFCPAPLPCQDDRVLTLWLLWQGPQPPVQ